MDSNVFVFGQPFIKEIKPLSGSIFGGTIMKINGNGFTSGVIINLGSANCRVINITLNEIFCISSAHEQAKTNITIRLVVTKLKL